MANQSRHVTNIGEALTSSLCGKSKKNHYLIKSIRQFCFLRGNMYNSVINNTLFDPVAKKDVNSDTASDFGWKKFPVAILSSLCCNLSQPQGEVVTQLDLTR
jgi:hypothetical protein